MSPDYTVLGGQGLPNIIPEHDEERLKTLYAYRILDTPPEEVFNKIANLAVHIFHTPVALISFVDRDRVWFKANIGMEAYPEVPRPDSLCSLAVLQPEPLIISDTLRDPYALTSPFVAREKGVRFYAAVPLKAFDGQLTGTLCVIDWQERSFSESDTAVLQDLASLVVNELDMRLRARRLMNDAK